MPKYQPGRAGWMIGGRSRDCHVHVIRSGGLPAGLRSTTTFLTSCGNGRWPAARSAWLPTESLGNWMRTLARDVQYLTLNLDNRRQPTLS
jgi:hypothetical protein